MKVGATTLKFQTAEQREKWTDQRSQQFCVLKEFKEKDRHWVIKTLSHDLCMVDSTPFTDEDGDTLWRVVYEIDKQGRPYERHGCVHVCSTQFLRFEHAKVVSDVALQKKLDKWIKSAKEMQETTDERSGIQYNRVVIKPLKLNVPGWERVTAAEAKKRMKNLAKQISGVLFGAAGNW